MFTKWIFFQKRNASDQQVQKKVFNITNHQGSENKIHSEISPHTGQMAIIKKTTQKQTKKKTPAYICLRNLYAGQEAKIGTRHGTTDFFQIGKGVHQGCILSPCLFNLNAEYIM